MTGRLTCVLLLVLLSGCTSSPESEVVLWHAYRGDEAAALKTTVDEYLETPGAVRVRLVSVPYDAFANKLRVSIPKGNGPDIFIFAHDQVGDWAARGLVESLSFWSSESQLDGFLPETLDPLVFDDAIFGWPMAFKTLALFYDRKYVQQPPKTMGDLFASVDALRQSEPAVWGFGYPIENYYYHAIWLHAHQGRVLGANARPVLTSDAMEKSFSYARNLLKREGLVPPELSPALMTSLFNQRKLAFVINGPWFRGEIATDHDWGVATIPLVNETQQAAKPYLGVEALMMSAASPRKEAAIKVMRALTSESAAYERWRTARQLVANQAVYGRDDVKNDRFSIAFRAQLSRTVPLSNRPEMRHVWSPLQRALNEAVIGDGAVVDALNEAQRAVLRALK